MRSELANYDLKKPAAGSKHPGSHQIHSSTVCSIQSAPSPIKSCICPTSGTLATIMLGCNKKHAPPCTPNTKPTVRTDEVALVHVLRHLGLHHIQIARQRQEVLRQLAAGVESSCTVEPTTPLRVPHRLAASGALLHSCAAKCSDGSCHAVCARLALQSRRRSRPTCC